MEQVKHSIRYQNANVSEEKRKVIKAKLKRLLVEDEEQDTACAYALADLQDEDVLMSAAMRHERQNAAQRQSKQQVQTDTSSEDPVDLAIDRDGDEDEDGMEDVEGGSDGEADRLGDLDFILNHLDEDDDSDEAAVQSRTVMGDEDTFSFNETLLSERGLRCMYTTIESILN